MKTSGASPPKKKTERVERLATSPGPVSVFSVAAEQQPQYTKNFGTLQAPMSPRLASSPDPQQMWLDIIRCLSYTRPDLVEYHALNFTNEIFYYPGKLIIYLAKRGAAPWMARYPLDAAARLAGWPGLQIEFMGGNSS